MQCFKVANIKNSVKLKFTLIIQKMGIKNINELLKKIGGENVDRMFKNVPCSNFAGCKIAVDATNQVCVLWSRAYKSVVDRTDICFEEPNLQETEKVFMHQCRQYINQLLSVGCTPVMVFDGKHPQQKSDTQKKRREKKQTTLNRISEFRKNLENVDILDRTMQMDYDLKKLYGQVMSPSYPAIDCFKRILAELGLPVLQATGEAEQLCCMLYLDGHVSAVLTTDTDALVYGCSMLITGMIGNSYNSQYGKYEPHFSCVYLKAILQELQLNQRKFIDLCIMSGCDYNNNMKRVASGNSYKLIKEYGSIENLPGKYDISCLDHEFCRQQFSYVNSIMVSDTKFSDCRVNLKVFDQANQVLTKNEYLRFQLESWYDDLCALIYGLPKPVEGTAVKINLDQIPVKLNFLKKETLNSHNNSNSNNSNCQKNELECSETPEDYISQMIAELELNNEI